MRLGSSTDKKDSGRLHVDFAQARDDFYEWECKQRMRAREERHRRKLEEDRLRPPSPPAIMHYSEHEATLLAEKLKGRRPLPSEREKVWPLNTEALCVFLLLQKLIPYNRSGGVGVTGKKDSAELGPAVGTEPCSFPALSPLWSGNVCALPLNNCLERGRRARSTGPKADYCTLTCAA